MQRDANLGKIVNELPFNINEYNMSVENNSKFLDIGSGFGKPVFHAAMQTKCNSKGVEVVPVRVSFCEDQKYNFEEYFKEKIAKQEKVAKKQSANKRTSKQQAPTCPTKITGKTQEKTQINVN